MVPKTWRLLLIVVVVVALFVPPGPVAAQRAGKVARVGWVAFGPSSAWTERFVDALRDGLRDTGWIEGQNLTIEQRWGDRDQASELVADLVRRKTDVIVTQGPMVFGAQAAAGTTPVVFGFSGDPVEAKLVSSLARPGGNLTGMTFLAFELVGKRLDLLKEAVPGLTRVAALANVRHPGEQAELRESQIAARRLGVALQYVPLRTASDFPGAYAAMASENAQAIVAFPDATVMSHAKEIAEFANRRRIPAVSGWAEFADAGNFMTYGPDLHDTWRHMAVYVDKILRGAKPADIPVEQPSKFELVVNARAARAIGLTIAPSFLARATRVID